MVGRLSEERTKIMNDVLKTGISIDFIMGWGQQRDNDLFKYKILVNVQGGKRPYNIFEEMRCNRCIFNKMIIVTEKRKYLDDNPLRKYIIECESVDIPATLLHVLKNYKQIHQKLFADFDIQKIKKYYNKYIDDLFL